MVVEILKKGPSKEEASSGESAIKEEREVGEISRKQPSEDEALRGEVVTGVEREKEEEEMKKIPSGTKCKGVVRVFNRTRGFGFIKLKETDKFGVFVHAYDLLTDDPFPFLKKGTKVEFEMVFRNGRPYAGKVTLEGGKNIPSYTISDLGGVVNEKSTFTGIVTLFRHGFGFIAPDKPIYWRGVTCQKKIFFYLYGLVMKEGKGFLPKISRGSRVSFKVYYDSSENLSACEIHNEDGSPIEGIRRREFNVSTNRNSLTMNEKLKRMRMSQAARKSKQRCFGGYAIADLKKMLEEEEKKLKKRDLIEDGRMYNGIIKIYYKKRGWGRIQLTERIWHKGCSLKYTIIFKKSDSVFFSPQTVPLRGAEVMFGVFLHNKFVRAGRVKNIDGTPIGVLLESSKQEDKGKTKNEDAGKKRKRDEEVESFPDRKKMKRDVANEGKIYTGTLRKYKFARKRTFWVIKIEEKIEYKEFCVENSILAHKWDLRGKKIMQKKDKVNFKVYVCEGSLAAFQLEIQIPPKQKKEPTKDKVNDESSPTEQTLKKNTEIQTIDEVK